MVKIQVNNQGKAYLTSGNKLLQADTDTITATNNTGAAISAGSKVWVNQNSLDKFYSNNINYITIGSLTVNNKIVSGFSISNYIQEPTFNPQGNTWEILRKVHTGNSLSNSTIFHSKKAGTSQASDRFGITFRVYNSLFNFAISSNGTSWNNNNGTYTVLADTDYWVKCSYDGTTYKLFYSLDGENFIEDISFTDNAIIALYETLEGVFWNDGYVDAWGGTIDYSVGYNKINGVITWTPYFPNIDENTLTGVAQENIAVNSTGDVKVLEI